MVAAIGSGVLMGCRASPVEDSSAAGPELADSPAAAVTAAAGSPGGQPGSIFVVVLENRSYSEAMAAPYFRSLASAYAIVGDYHAIAHPSLPNYLALTSGSTWGVRDDAYHVLPAQGLGDQLSKAGIAWKAYAEAFNGSCIKSPYPYSVKHNPFAYYGGGCPSNIVPLTQLTVDLDGATPRLAWLIPGLCNDGHDCPMSTVDDWLEGVVPTIIGSAAWRNDGLLLITFDEDDGAGNQRVATLVIAPNLASHVLAGAYDHYSLLATVEDRLGVGRLRSAARATPLPVTPRG